MIQKKILDGIKKMIYVCGGAVLGYLLLVSLLSTCVIGASVDTGARVFYAKDYPIVHLAAFLLLMGAIYWLKKKTMLCSSYDRAARLVIAAWGMAAALWVLFYMEKPMHDPANVLLAAKQMRQYNFSSFIRGGVFEYLGGKPEFGIVFLSVVFLVWNR